MAGCRQLFDARRTLEQAFEAETAVLAHTIASKLSPALMAAHPLTEIEALVRECLDACRREPRLVVRVSEALLDPLGERIERVKAGTSFTGEIVLLSDPGLGPQDCRVEWPDGGAERDMTALERTIGEVVERYVSTTFEEGESPTDAVAVNGGAGTAGE